MRTVLVALFLLLGMQTLVSADTKARNRIVGVWETQVTILNCSTGDPIANFRGLNKYELGGTGQVVPATNPAALSAHMSIWSYVSGNDYQLAFKMFRFDAAGNYIGWVIVRFNVAINDEATELTASGLAELFDSNGNSVGMSCPTFNGTRFR